MANDVLVVEQTNMAVNYDRHLVFVEGSELCYNYKTRQWTHIPAYDGLGMYSIDDESADIGLVVFSSGSVDLQPQKTTYAVQTATITTAAPDVNQGGRVVVNGVRPRVNGGTPTVRVGVQDKISDSVTWSSSMSLNSRTEYANLRSEGRYVRAEITIPDSFTTAIGADVEFSPQGKV